MDIPRRKNLDRPDKLTAELLFFCFWLTHCGEVELGDFKWHCGERSSASYRRYAEELAACGAIPRLKLRDNGLRLRPAGRGVRAVGAVRFGRRSPAAAGASGVHGGVGACARWRTVGI